MKRKYSRFFLACETCFWTGIILLIIGWLNYYNQLLLHAGQISIGIGFVIMLVWILVTRKKKPEKEGP